MPHHTHHRQQRLLAKARARILKMGDFLPLEDLVRHFPERATLSQSRLEKWKQECRIFSIDHDGDAWYPRYAFSSNGELLDGLKDVLLVFSSSKDSWSLAFWFGSPSSLLGGALPRDRLIFDPGSVIRAAIDEVNGALQG